MAKFNLRGKVIDVEECKSIFSKTRGLMFRRNSRPLLFIFKKSTKQPIHSFFCKPFLAIWLNNGKIIDEKVVKPFCFSVKPKAAFTHLVEIPLGDDNKNSKISDGNRKI